MMAATLYRCPVPTNVLCPCGKVARKLNKEGIEFETVRVPLRKAARHDVLQLTGQTSVPVLEAEGRAVCDSKRIVEWVEQLAASFSGVSPEA